MGQSNVIACSGVIKLEQVTITGLVHTTQDAHNLCLIEERDRANLSISGLNKRVLNSSCNYVHKLDLNT